MVGEGVDQDLSGMWFEKAKVSSPKGDPHTVIKKRTDGFPPPARNGAATGFILKSLMTCVRVLGYEPALKLAALDTQTVFNEREVFTPDNTFRQGGHMHGNLRTLVGAADYALYVGDPVLFGRVDAIYRYVRSEATRFGFLPEVIGRKGDIVATETCALMDYLGLAVTLANHGHP